jgi:hypothetical protein
MRRFFPLASALLLAACATTPEAPAPLPAVGTGPAQHVHSSIIGMAAAELVGHLGNPALQVREGPGLKMQFRSRECVLDAYLYPPATGAGVTRVTHSDARRPSGADTNQAACISAIEALK